MALCIIFAVTTFPRDIGSLMTVFVLLSTFGQTVTVPPVSVVLVLFIIFPCCSLDERGDNWLSKGKSNCS